jgi:hypothetical protein
MNPNMQQEFDITIPAIVVAIIAIVITVIVIRLLRKARRSAFLDSFQESSIQELISAAKEIGLLWMDEIIKLNGLLDRSRYHAAALGGFVESLLFRFPSDDNFQRVAEFLAYAKPGYQAKFVGAMTRHEEVDKRFGMAFVKAMQDKEGREYDVERARAIEKGVKLCKK